jgi:hypothetical protein
MKKTVHWGILITGCAISLFGMGSAIADTGGLPPVVVGSEFHTGYVPDGFDTNDNAQLVAEGLFRNSCYRPASVKVDVDHSAKTITLHPTAYEYEGYCLQVMIPFDQAIDVGILKAGTYQVIQSIMGEQNVLGQMKVRIAANSAADDYLYAPVSQAYFEKKPGKPATVRVSGEFTSSCMKLAEVMVSVQPNVIVLQPISTLQDRGDCVQGKFPFEKQVQLANMKTGRYLLHVRSLSGKSINTLVDVQ